eukprot:7869714-Karenia_brevis.AAC.1
MAVKQLESKTQFDGMCTAERWESHKTILKQAGKIARDLLLSKGDDAAAQDMVYTSISRSFYSQDLHVAQQL